MPALIPIFLTPANAKLLEALWNDHSGAVHAMLIAYCGNPSDAGDILQDLFLRLSRDPSTLATMKSPRAFLIVSARRLAIDLARKRSAELRRQESPEAIDNFHPAPSTPLADKDLRNIINAALQKLPTDQRSVIKSKMIEGKTLAAIAEEQGIPLNTVASRLRYSLDKLRNELRPHYEHMKNPNAHSSNSSERLIKPLEPKRVPSVAPGLEGVAACAVFDHLDEAPSIAPGVYWDDSEPNEPEISILPAPEDSSLETTDSTDSDPEIIYCGLEGEGMWVKTPDAVEFTGEGTRFGEWINLPPDAITTADWVDSDQDGIDDRRQPEVVINPDPEIADCGLEGGNAWGDYDPSELFYALFDGDDSEFADQDDSEENLDEPFYALFKGGDSELTDNTKIDPPFPFEKVFSLGSPVERTVSAFVTTSALDSTPEKDVSSYADEPEVIVSESQLSQQAPVIIESSLLATTTQAEAPAESTPPSVKEATAARQPTLTTVAGPISAPAIGLPALDYLVDSVTSTSIQDARHDFSSFGESDLPPSVITFHIPSTHADEAMDDVVFVDEASDAPHDRHEIADAEDVSSPIATQAASAALTGAFVLGSTTQTPSVRGNPSRFSKSL